MNKQEEIREDKIARIDGWLKGYLFELVSFVQQNPSLHMIGASWYDKEIKQIKQALHSQGVVIKVGGISDDLAQTTSQGETYYADKVGLSWERNSNVFKAFKDAGYVAVEPLIVV